MGGLVGGLVGDLAPAVGAGAEGELLADLAIGQGLPKMACLVNRLL